MLTISTLLWITVGVECVLTTVVVEVVLITVVVEVVLITVGVEALLTVFDETVLVLSSLCWLISQKTAPHFS